MKRRRMTTAQKRETVAIFYGINPETLEVDTVYVTRDGHMTKYGKDMAMHTHYSVHRNPHSVEVRIVYRLQDMIEVHPQFSNDAHTKEQIEALKAKAAQMRAEKEASQKSAGEGTSGKTDERPEH